MMLVVLKVVIAFEPQSVHDSGVGHNHQYKGKKCQDIPQQIISHRHPLLRINIHTRVSFLVKVPNQERRNIEK